MKESDPSKIISKDIFEIFDNDIAISITNQIHKFQSMALDSIALGTSSAKNYMLLRMKSCWEGKTETLLCCSVTGCSNPPDTYILEMETISDPSFALPNNHILQSGDIVGRIRAGASPEAVSAAFCDAAMEILSDYDRGMVYRFAEDCTGEVIHEKIRSEAVWTAGSGLQSSYLNMRFPAEDIPKQARALYLKNGLRFIFDVNGVDSPIISGSAQRLDLSMSCLRAVPRCHIEYLRNMGIVSALSIAIVVNNSLWGLYTLHSYKNTAKPSVEQRIMLEMLGSISAMRIDFFEREKSSRRKLDINNLMLSLSTSKNVHEFLRRNEKEVLDLIDAQTLVMYE
jgi:light-regulated signal transduction histidine kinase (bacteriophytochrome)